MKRKSVRDKVFEIYGHKCYFCGQPTNDLHHIIPKSLGGDNSILNLIPLCSECETKIHKLIDPLVNLLKK